jgi:hypothetical protein
MTFSYLIGKIKDCPFQHDPFRHIQINGFFSERDFARITAAQDILVPTARTDDDLFAALFAAGFKIINFPGCTIDRKAYVKWHQSRSRQSGFNNSSCEGFGITLRLTAPASAIMSDLVDFMNSAEFQSAMAEKFDIDIDTVRPDTGIQKYLDGYEISPHPDMRAKALTYMVNMNPAPESETQDHHTHYMTFTSRFAYVRAYWDGRPDEDRCWVPWSWCETVKMQTENNSLVAFSPNNTTLHGVKANYDHLAHQRTQMYGNLWYRHTDIRPGPEWEDLMIVKNRGAPARTLASAIRGAVPAAAREIARIGIGRSRRNQDATVAHRPF